MSPRLLPALVPILLAVASSSSSPARATAAEPKKTPTFGTEVSLVSLPVFVADHEGHALRGLQPEDFELYDDGKRMPVVSFQYVDTSSAESQEQISQAPAARRRFLLLFDMSFTDVGGLHRAREAAARFVRRNLADSDLAAVATFDANRGIRIVANFTEDRALLAHAVETLGVPSVARISDPLGLAANLASTDVQGAGVSRAGEQTQTLVESVLAAIARLMRTADDNFYRSRVMNLIGSMEELARGLRGVEGRKQILYFSAGFDSRALVGQSGSEMRTSSEAVIEGRLQDVDTLARHGDSRLREVLSEMTRALSSADCVVHSIDVTGLGTDNSLTQTSVSADLGRDTGGQTGGRESLHYVSAETGGRFFKDTNDLGAVLGEVLDMTSRYYILGYQPEDLQGPGRFHKLKVKVHRKGVKVSHRAGYHERLPVRAQTALQRKFEAAQLVMTGVGTHDLDFSALCLPFPVPGDRQNLGVVVQVPREQVRWEKGSPVVLELYGYAVGADGTVYDHLAQMARLNPDQVDPKQEARGLSFYGNFQVPPGQYTIKLMLQEPETGAAGVQFQDVTVPPYDSRVGFLLPPVVMDDPSRWLGVNLARGAGGPEASPFAVAGQPFLPRTTFRVESGTPEKLVLIAYEPDRPSDPAAGIEIQSTLTDATGMPVSSGLMSIQKVHREAGGRRTYVLGYTPEGLVPGEYKLRIGIGESGTRLEAYSLLRVAAGNGGRATPQ